MSDKFRILIDGVSDIIQLISDRLKNVDTYYSDLKLNLRSFFSFEFVYEVCSSR